MAKRRTKRRDDDYDAADEAPPKGADSDSTAASTGAVENNKEPSMAVSDEKGVGADESAAAEDVVISAPVHCDGCARKLRRSLQRLDGVGEVSVDSRANTVVVSGPGAVDIAAEAMEIVQRKTGKKATLLKPSKGARGMKESDDDDVIAGVIDIAEEMVIVLRINLHCDACCDEIKRRILKIQGVKEAAPLLKSSQLVVKGTVEPATLVGFIYRSTGRKAAITRAEPLDHHHLPPTTDDTTKHQQDPSVLNNNQGEKKNGHHDAGHKEMDDDGAAPPSREDEQKNDNNGGNEKKLQRTDQKPSDDGDRGDDDGDAAPTKNGFVVENHKDYHLFRAPLPNTTGVVTAVAPEMMAFSPYYSYPPSYYPYYAQQHQSYQPYPYAYYSCPAMYGNYYPHGPPGAFSEENPNTCTIV